MQTQTPSQATGQENLPLAGFYRLYEAQLRAERKSPKTIKNYNEALGKFTRWFEETYGRAAVLAGLNLVEARVFLAGALEAPKLAVHPLLEGAMMETLAGSTVHLGTRPCSGSGKA